MSRLAKCRLAMLTGLAALAFTVAQGIPASAATITWTPIKASDASAYARFGTSVAITPDGSVAVVGGQNRSNSSGVSIPAAAYVYFSLPTNGALPVTEDAQLSASDGQASDLFGFSVAVSADGNTVAVGAPNHNLSGAVYIFARSGSTWLQTAELNAPAGASSGFGKSVALSGNGLELAVGAPGTGSEPGTASFYLGDSSTGSWNFANQVTGVAQSALGTSVAISSDGTVAAIGAPKYTVTSGGVITKSDRVLTYGFNGTVWVSQSTIAAPTGVSGGDFGRSVALSSNGTALVAGAPGVISFNGSGVDGLGVLYNYSTGGWTRTTNFYVSTSASCTGGQLGQAAALSADGTTVSLGQPSGNTSGCYGGNGALMQWKLTGSSWIRTAVGGEAANDSFGYSLAAAGGGEILIGALSHNQGTVPRAGAAYLYSIT